jgi:hypothetical protein
MKPISGLSKGREVAMRKGPLVILVLSIFLAGCIPVDLFESSAPTESGGVLFWDDFSDPTSGWDTWAEARSMVIYENGGLRFHVGEPNYDFWSRPGKRYEDARIAVEATLLDGPQNNDYGILCRYRNPEHFYAFLISSDGYAGIIKVTGGEYQVISAETMEYHEAIKTGKETNFIGVDCSGSNLVMHVNNERVAQAEDSEYVSGEVGLLVGAYDEPDVDVFFDNFVVAEP